MWHGIRQPPLTLQQSVRLESEGPGGLTLPLAELDIGLLRLRHQVHARQGGHHGAGAEDCKLTKRTEMRNESLFFVLVTVSLFCVELGRTNDMFYRIPLSKELWVIFHLMKLLADS